MWIGGAACCFVFQNGFKNGINSYGFSFTNNKTKQFCDDSPLRASDLTF
jgi:hypothetical protein